MAGKCADPSRGGRDGPTEADAETLDTLLARSTECLRVAGLADPRREARALIAHALALSPEALLRLGRTSVVPTARAEALVARRALREPFAFITGTQGFWSLDLAVSPATLIPRADTESVVEAALAAVDRTSSLRVLDLGTGTGAILLALLAEWPTAFGLGLDRSEAACVLARGNAKRNGLGARSAFVCGDWATALGGDVSFDVVVSNPPYIPRGEIAELMPEVACHEPRLALDGGEDGLDAYRQLARAAARLLTPAGVAVFEIGLGQGPEVASIAAAAGLRSDGRHVDLGGHLRALAFRR